MVRLEKILKLHNGSIKNSIKNDKKNKLLFGKYGIRAAESGRIRQEHLETIRRIFIKKGSKSIKLWFRTVVDFSITKKPKSIRMGKGKGAIDHLVSRVSAGSILIEIEGVEKPVFLEAYNVLCKKLPIRTYFVELEE